MCQLCPKNKKISVCIWRKFANLALKFKNRFSGYFWHVTDFHLDTNYSTTGAKGQILRDEESLGREYFLGDYKYDTCWGRAQGQFGDYNCDSPMKLIKSAVNFVKNHSETITDGDVKFVIWTGYALFAKLC